jgi:hypothetical protein
VGGPPFPEPGVAIGAVATHALKENATELEIEQSANHEIHWRKVVIMSVDQQMKVKIWCLHLNPAQSR